MKFLLITLGSTGDIRPFIAVGLELQRRGHTCTLATQQAFQQEVEQAGLQFHALLRGPELNRLDSMMLEIFVRGTGPRIVDYFYNLIFGELSSNCERLLELIDNADCLLASYLFPFFALIAEKRGVPAFTLSLSHRFYPSRNHQPLMEKRRRMPLNAASWSFFFWFIERKLRKHLRRHRLIDLLPGNFQLREYYTTRTFLGVPSVFEENLDPEDRQGAFLGAMRVRADSQPLPAEVGRFLEDGNVPLLNFGSVTFTGVEKVMRDFLRHWPRDRKILVQAGWAGFRSAEAPPHILFAGSLPHATLFPRLSAIIHHGGAGTTAAALHAGLPQIIIPHIADQWFMAGEIARLGCGIELPRRQWPRRLPETLARMEQNHGLRARVKAVAKRLQKDPGAEIFAARLEVCARKRRLIP